MKMPTIQSKNGRLVLIGIGVSLAIVAILVLIKLMQFSAMSEAAAMQVMPPEPVNAITVDEVTWHPRMTAVGTIVALQGTEVSTELDGVVREIAFDAGSTVNAGDILIRMDTEVEKTQLRIAEAAVDLARTSFIRAKDLTKTRNISQADFDAARINLQSAEAQVDNIRALIAKKTVRAPFAGTLGIRRISVGQFLSKGSQIVSLQALDPVNVDFSIPQTQLGDMAPGLDVIVTSDSYAKSKFTGKISALNPDIDTATRNLRVQARLANPDGKLRPGMFVEVELILARTENVLVIPETAVIHAPFGDSVFVIEPDPKSQGDNQTLVLRQQFVQLGIRQGDFVVVKEGVKAGERVASTGAFKLRGGMPVVIDNKLAPKFELYPTPNNT
jgi:membrane fusion protein (multidrug efflux system)